jgi:hypothetical protein
MLGYVDVKNLVAVVYACVFNAIPAAGFVLFIVWQIIKHSG